MDLLWQSFREALRLVFTGDAMVLDAAWRSLWISSTAVALATLLGLPLGILLARHNFPGQALLVLLVRAGMALPTVFVGMVCYALFSRRGPLGPAELLYSPWGIVCGELLLALPIVIGLTHGAVRALDPRVGETVQTLSLSPLRRGWTYLSEARTGVLLAILTAFARCVTELGVAMIVGGNLKDRTRTLATATALETGRGEFARGLAMSSLLLVVALGAFFLMTRLTREEK